MSKLRNTGEVYSNSGSLDCEFGIQPLSYTAAQDILARILSFFVNCAQGKDESKNEYQENLARLSNNLMHRLQRQWAIHTGGIVSYTEHIITVSLCSVV